MRRFLSSSLWLRSCKLVDPSRKSTGWFVVLYSCSLSSRLMGHGVARVLWRPVLSAVRPVSADPEMVHPMCCEMRLRRMLTFILVRAGGSGFHHQDRTYVSDDVGEALRHL